MSFLYGVLLPGSGQILATGLCKAYVGGQWVWVPVKYWTGSAWVQKKLKYWDGAAWSDKGI